METASSSICMAPLELIQGVHILVALVLDDGPAAALVSDDGPAVALVSDGFGFGRWARCGFGFV